LGPGREKRERKKKRGLVKEEIPAVKRGGREE